MIAVIVIAGLLFVIATGTTFVVMISYVQALEERIRFLEKEIKNDTQRRHSCLTESPQ